jgi:3',5'-cyclic AMP phosphodiesterase CpdA
MKTLMTRRAALERLSGGVLLSLGLWPGASRARDVDSGSFRFLVVNDLHFMSPECGVWLEKLMRQMKSHAGVEFCLVAGDVTEHGKLEHHGAVRELLSTLDMPTHVVVGNHDYDAAEKSRKPYDKVFRKQINYSFEHRGWQFIGLDTSEGLKFENTRIQPDTFRWVDETLFNLNKHRPTVVFTHFPVGAGVRYRPLNADELLEPFKPFNLQAIFSGHYHAFTERNWQHAIVTTNRCCALKRGNHDGTKEKGYFLCTAADGKISREFVEFKG